MGFLYVKVIESKKVAVRSSFFVNYPFIRLVIGKEKRDTGFKPGVEWWDKIYNFRDISCDDDIVMYAQARDKSIHVFGSDWLGEAPIKLKPLMDGKVHQMWFKLGKGKKQHSRTPRGYLHLAFQYFHEPLNGQRPFAQLPVEEIMAFEDWLALQDNAESRVFSSSTSSVNPSSYSTRSSEAEKLRKSAPADNRLGSSSSARAAPLGSKPKSKSNVSFKNTPETIKNRPRASTLPTDVQSPHTVRRSAIKKTSRSDDENSDASSDASDDEEVVKTANLIDLSLFDSPKGKSTGRQSYDVGDKFDRIPSPTESPMKISHSLSGPAVNAAPLMSSQEPKVKINNVPTFNEWYHKDAAQNTFNPANPFVSMHEAHAPAFTVKN